MTKREENEIRRREGRLPAIPAHIIKRQLAGLRAREAEQQIKIDKRIAAELQKSVDRSNAIIKDTQAIDKDVDAYRKQEQQKQDRASREAARALRKAALAGPCTTCEPMTAKEEEEEIQEDAERRDGYPTSIS